MIGETHSGPRYAGRVAIAAPTAKVGLLAELADMLAASMREVGAAHVSLIRSDPADVSSCDALVLFGDCVRLEPVVKALRSLPRSDRPKVILWQLDSLPPPGIDEDSLRKGLRAARAETNLRSKRLGLTAALAGAVPVESRRRLKSAMLRLHSPGVRTESSNVSPSARAAEHRQVIRRFERIEWLLRAAEEGLVEKIFMSSPERVALLDRLGVPSEMLPVGYDPKMGADLGNPRDIDAMFLGYEPTTKMAAASLGEVLSAKGIELQIPEGFILGDERVRTLNKVKIFLNLHRHEDFWELSRVRLLLGMACGAMIVSDHAAAVTEPFVPGRHFVVSTRERLPEVIEDYVRDDDARNRVVVAATELLAGYQSMSQCAATLLESL